MLKDETSMYFEEIEELFVTGKEHNGTRTKQAVLVGIPAGRRIAVTSLPGQEGKSITE